MNFTMADNSERTLTHIGKSGGYESENEAMTMSFSVPTAYKDYYKYIDVETAAGVKTQYGPIAPGTVIFTSPLYRGSTVQGLLQIQLVFKQGEIEIHSKTDALFVGRSINATEAVVEGQTDVIQTIVESISNVDNTHDTDKPVSAAAQTALNNKQDNITVNGIIKGDGSALSAAVAGEDYATPEQALSYTSTHNGSDTAHTDIRELIATARSIAEGASQSVTKVDYSTLVTWIKGLSATALRTGRNINVITKNVPDLWVSVIYAEYVDYAYTTDSAIEDAITADGYIHIGYYGLSALETQKVDLTDYYTKSETLDLFPIRVTQAEYDALVAAGTIETDRDYDVVG